VATAIARKRQRTQREQYFKNKIAYDQLQVDRLKALGFSEALNADIKKNPADFTTGIVDTLKRRALEISNDPEATSGMVRIWLTLCLQAISFEQMQGLRERKMRLREREVALREKQFNKLKKTMQDPKLNAEERARRCRQIFTLTNEPDEAQTGGSNGTSP
jgi:hypothetical protein